MRHLLLLLLLCSFACAGTQPVQYSSPTLPSALEKVFPARPDAEIIPSDKDWAVPLYKGNAAPNDGILLSAEKAARAKKWQIGYNEIRSLYELDRGIYKQTLVVYDERLFLANQEIKRLQPSFWDNNKGTIAFVGGVIVGSAVAVGIVFGVDYAEGN